jgi:hypothetical protein
MSQGIGMVGPAVSRSGEAMKALRIEIYTTVERNQALAAINDAITASDGWIAHHQLFSNISATLNFELPRKHCRNFVDRLSNEGFRLHMEGDPPAEGEGDMRGSLSVTFQHDDPDMRRDVPAFG